MNFFNSVILKPLIFSSLGVNFEGIFIKKNIQKSTVLVELPSKNECRKLCYPQLFVDNLFEIGSICENSLGIKSIAWFFYNDSLESSELIIIDYCTPFVKKQKPFSEKYALYIRLEHVKLKPYLIYQKNINLAQKLMNFEVRMLNLIDLSTNNIVNSIFQYYISIQKIFTILNSTFNCNLTIGETIILCHETVLNYKNKNETNEADFVKVGDIIINCIFRKIFRIILAMDFNVLKDPSINKIASIKKSSNKSTDKVNKVHFNNLGSNINKFKTMYQKSPKKKHRFTIKKVQKSNKILSLQDLEPRPLLECFTKHFGENESPYNKNEMFRFIKSDLKLLSKKFIEKFPRYSRTSTPQRIRSFYSVDHCSSIYTPCFNHRF